MRKNLIYALTAVILGILLVVTPFFLAPTIENLEYHKAESIPQTFSEKTKAFEHAYEPRENVAQSLFNNILIFTAGFAVAFIVHLLVKAKFSK